MRIRLWFRFVLALITVTFPLAAVAQFQPPTEEELKMTSDPKTPGAAAIYLYREEITDDNLHYHSFYARIKVLTEKGKELATVHVPYWRTEGDRETVNEISGRTIHADGTIVPLNVKPSDLVDAKFKDVQAKQTVFTLPNVEVGSILEYRWQLNYDDGRLSSPYWEIQQPYFVRKARYSFIPYQYLYRITDNSGKSSGNVLYSYRGLKDSKVIHVAGADKYTLDVADVAAEPDEDYMPPRETFREAVYFYYSPYTEMEEFWKSEGGDWSKRVNHFADETGIIKDAARSLVAPTDSELVKAQKIYDAVTALDNTDYSRTKSHTEKKDLKIKEIKNAQDVWGQRSGSGDELALLYLTLARAAGLKAYGVAVCDRNQHLFDPYYLSLSQLDDVMVIVSIDGKEVDLDPGKKSVAFGQLDWTHLLSVGLRQTDKEPAFHRTGTNPYKTASTIRAADITVAADGSVTGTARLTMSGPPAARWRKIALENDEGELKKQFNEYMQGMVPDGVQVDFDHFLGLEDFHSQLMAVMKVSGNMGTATGKRAFLPGVFFASQAKHPFVAEEKRIAPIDMSYAEMVQDQVIYHLPDSFAVESAVADTTIPWKDHAVFQLKSTADKNTVTVNRNLSRAVILMGPDDYVALRDFYQKVATADQQQLVLTRAATAASN